MVEIFAAKWVRLMLTRRIERRLTATEESAQRHSHHKTSLPARWVHHMKTRRLQRLAAVDAELAPLTIVVPDLVQRIGYPARSEDCRSPLVARVHL